MRTTGLADEPRRFVAYKGRIRLVTRERARQIAKNLRGECEKCGKKRPKHDPLFCKKHRMLNVLRARHVNRVKRPFGSKMLREPRFRKAAR